MFAAPSGWTDPSEEDVCKDPQERGARGYREFHCRGHVAYRIKLSCHTVRNFSNPAQRQNEAMTGYKQACQI